MGDAPTPGPDLTAQFVTVPKSTVVGGSRGKAVVQVNKERVDYWIGKGAQASDSVRTLIARHLTPAPAAAPAPAPEAK